ncbi:MAG: hypothetical protein LBT04_00540 [Prevotellaceae bacterium]|nr:hypothetical protein [Prevotellaceae bacterium]
MLAFYGIIPETVIKTTAVGTQKKAILDMLYLYPFYNNEQEISEVRFDEDFMQHDLNVEFLNEYTNKFQSKTVRKRVDLLLKIYAL